MIRQYIGARYTPKFSGVYDPTQQYENLEVVDNGSGTSYISKKIVPPNTPLTDTEYWAIYGASSGAILDLQTRVGALETDMTNVDADVVQLKLDVNALNGSVLGIKSDVTNLNNRVNRLATGLQNKKFMLFGDSYGLT